MKVFALEVHMSEEDLELLITLDDPEGAPEEDTFHHHPSKIMSSIGSVSRSTIE